MSAEQIMHEPQHARQSFDIIVVGMGPVGLHFLQKLTAINTSLSIAVFGDEPWEPYNRVKLSSLVSGEIKESAIYDNYAMPLSDLLTPFFNNRIVAIDRYSHEVVDSHGKRYGYSHLVIATGSHAHVPAIEGVGLKNVFRFRDLHDAISLMGRSVSTRKTVVIGGGLLGLEAARSMQRFNTEVHVVEHDMWLMFQQLDETAGIYLRTHIEQTGIQVHTSRHVQKISGTDKVEAIQLSNGDCIECDTVIMATGINPNIELALESGLHVGRGIKVNDHLQSNDQNIYAIGECAEHEDKVYGLVGPGYEQAAVLAHLLAGKKSTYKGSVSAAKLKVVGLPVFSAGDALEWQGHIDQYVYEVRDQGIYRKIYVRNGRLTGVVGIGEWPGIQRFQEAIAKRRRIWPWQTVRFVEEGVLWNDVLSENVIDWPATATVCNCTGVTRGQLEEAHMAGALSVEQMASATGASTVCGSCKSLLCDFAGGNSTPEPSKGASVLLLSSIVAILAAILFFMFPAIQYTTSVQSDWAIDILWRDGFIKQVSGFSILGIAVFISVISLRKRVKKFVKLWDYAGWRIFHVLFGLLVLLALFMHTGFRLGNNLNFALMMVFSSLLLVGGLATFVIAYEHKLSRRMAKQMRSITLWSHIVLLWPLPALLGFHILKTYYF